MARSLQEHVAEEIRAEMGRQRVSGAELARRLGVSDAWISHRLSRPYRLSVGDVEAIASLLDRPASTFFPPAPARASAA